MCRKHGLQEGCGGTENRLGSHENLIASLPVFSQSPSVVISGFDKGSGMNSSWQETTVNAHQPLPGNKGCTSAQTRCSWRLPPTRLVWQLGTPGKRKLASVISVLIAGHLLLHGIFLPVHSLKCSYWTDKWRQGTVGCLACCVVSRRELFLFLISVHGLYTCNPMGRFWNPVKLIPICHTLVQPWQEYRLRHI